MPQLFLTLSCALRANEEVFYGEKRTDNGNVHINVHVNAFHEPAVRFVVVPMVRGRNNSLYVKKARQAVPKLRERLNVVVRLIQQPVEVVEIDIGHYEPSVRSQKLLDLGELLSLKSPDVFENSLCQDDVELLVAKSDRGSNKIQFEQVWRGVVYCHIDAVVVYVFVQKVHQGCRPATNIKKIALLPIRDRVYNAR
jgi:hypothetical protein